MSTDTYGYSYGSYEEESAYSGYSEEQASYIYTGEYTDDYSDDYTQEGPRPARKGASAPPAASGRKLPGSPTTCGPQHSPAPKAPAAAAKVSAPARDQQESSSYSYDSYDTYDSYSYDEEGYSDDFSYSDSYTASATAPTPPQRRPPVSPPTKSATKPAAAPAVPARRTAPAKLPTPKQPSDSYSYSYDDGSYTGSTMTYSGEAGGSESYDDDYYSYDEESNSYSYSYSTESTGLAAPAAPAKSGVKNAVKLATSDSYPYSYSYSDSGYSGSYTPYSSSYSYSQSASGEKKKAATSASYSYSGTYSDTYDDGSYSDYYDSYGDGSKSYTYSDTYDSYYTSTATVTGPTKKTVVVATKSPSETTSSYTYSSEMSSTSSSAETDHLVEQRDLLVLRTPVKDTPQVPPPPKRCFIRVGSRDDAVCDFVRQLMIIQRAYEVQRSSGVATARSEASTAVAATPASGPPSHLVGTESVVSPAEAKKAKKEAKTKARQAAKEQKKASKKAKDHTRSAAPGADEADEPFAGPTPEGHFSRRSVRFALRTLSMNHVERVQALGSVSQPVPQTVLLKIVNACAVAKLKETVAQTFLARDEFRSGELPVTTMADVLSQLGVARSPVIANTFVDVAVDTAPTSALRLVLAVSQQSGDVINGVDPETAPSTATPQTGGWERRHVDVVRIVREAAHAKQPTSVRLERGTIWMGSHAICQGIASEEDYERLKTYIQAATYVCVLSDLFSVSGSLEKVTVVQYPHLVRSMLMVTPPPHSSDRRRSSSDASTADWKLLLMENLFRTQCHPLERLAAYAQGRGVSVYHGAAAVESTLHATKDSGEKRRRNVVPTATPDGMRFEPVTITKDDASTTVMFRLCRVLVPAPPPPGSRCFCLVSALTPDNIFLPAIEVEAVSVRPRNSGEGCVWTFTDSKKDKLFPHTRYHSLVFTGPQVDRLYVECCYETPTSSVAAACDVEGACPENVTESTEAWSAGYCVVALKDVKSGTFPTQYGSLLDAECAFAQGPVATAESATESATAKPKKGFFSFLSRKKKTSPANAAHAIVVEVKPPSSELLCDAEQLPSRFLALGRHLHVTALLRAAVARVGEDCAHTSQALRQQTVRAIFVVAADAPLLDQLAQLWQLKRKSQSKKTKLSPDEELEMITRYAVWLAALHNCSVRQRHEFAALLMKPKPLLLGDADHAAPQKPILV